MCDECKDNNEEQPAHELVDAAEAPKPTSTLCDECFDNNERQPAIKFCKICERFICKTCSDIHQRQSITKSHELVDATEAPKPTSTLCDECKDNNEEQPAIKFCKICERFICKTCSDIHQRQSITKTHELVDATEAPKPTSTLCDECKDNNEEQPAIKYCKICERFICKTCSDIHQRQSITKSHELVDATEAPKPTSTLCDECKDNNEEQPAIKYCKICERFICKTCSDIHQRQSITKSHELVDATEAPKPTSTLCDECKDHNEEQPAIKYCKVCERFICKTCSDIHQRQSITKSHELVDATEAPKPTSTLCDECKDNNEEQPAIKYCKICERFICKTCSDIHQRQSITKSHELVDATEAPKPTSTLCDECKDHNEEQPAIKYCKVCERFICKTCSDIHQRQSITKSHELVDATEAPKPTSTLCDECKDNNEEHPAIKFCKICERFICKTCSDIHQRQSITKSHELIGATEAPKPTGTLCDECKDNNEEKPAIKFCKICERFICKTCSDIHQRQSITKSHELVDATEAPKPTSTLCDECKDNNEEHPAIKYCKVCERFICQTFSTIYQRQSITKSHELVDVKEAPKQTLTVCDDCKSNDEEKPAVKYCIKCESFLCQTCTDIHQRQKITKFHEIVDPSEAPKPTLTLCDDCKSNDEETPAVKYCIKCESFLCKTCTDIHQRQKITKFHEIVDPSEAPKPTLTLCDDCKSNAEEKPATKYCIKCESFLCKTCSGMHQRERTFKSHELVDATEAPIREICPERSLEKINDTTEKAKKPSGKPRAKNVTTDSVDLYWESGADSSGLSYYQIRYKNVDNDSGWQPLQTEYFNTQATIPNLKADTKYVFQVRAVYGGGDGQYSQTSDEIFTLQSPATRIVQHLAPVRKGEPAVYAVPLTEIRPARNEQAQTRKFDVGSPPLQHVEEKTIMLVGATGTGKSTLVDGIVNYVLGVQWNDPFRFTMEKLEPEEVAHKGNQALSQTEWITCYTINQERGGRLNYKLTIIDTPGFGDTRGLARDTKTVDQIRQLFSAPDEKGILLLDAVCFLIKAPDARLTATQTYIFNAILSLFGNDIGENIRTLITFADGQDPPVLASLKESNLPFGTHFTFNNSGLFAGNKNLNSFSLAPMFWDMGIQSFREFFRDLATMTSVSLKLTKEVLEERQKLELTIGNLQPQVDVGLSKVAALKQELKIIEQHEVEIRSNQNFNYETDEVNQIMTELEPGVHVTNCLTCNYTCHTDCKLADDRKKARCSAMDQSTGNCKVCPKSCRWEQHKNTPYIFKYVTVKVQKTYEDMKRQYETAAGRKLNAEQVLQEKKRDFKQLQDDIELLMCIVNQSNNRLKVIALCPNPLNMVEHIDLMIQSEEMEKKEGFMQRVKALQECRKRATITTHVDRLNEQAVEIMKDDTKAALAKGKMSKGCSVS